jgi:hypothetical protein
VRTHSALIRSTRARATTLSARSWKAHRVRPAGGAPQARAISWAAWAPSSLRYCRPVGSLRANAVSRPPSTQAWRTRWTVATLGSKASALRIGPGAPAGTDTGCAQDPRVEQLRCRGASSVHEGQQLCAFLCIELDNIFAHQRSPLRGDHHQENRSSTTCQLSSVEVLVQYLANRLLGGQHKAPEEPANLGGHSMGPTAPHRLECGETVWRRLKPHFFGQEVLLQVPGSHHCEQRIGPHR